MKILLAVDDDPTGYEAAATVAEWYPDADVVALHVSETVAASRLPAVAATGGLAGYPVAVPGAWLDESGDPTEHAREVASQAAAVANGRSLVDSGDPARTIRAVAEDLDADLIVLGGRRRSWLSRLFDPSVSTSLAGDAPCSVLIVRAGPAR